MSKISIDAKLHALEDMGKGAWKLKALFVATILPDVPDGTIAIPITRTHGWHIDPQTGLDDGMPIYLPLAGSPAFKNPAKPTEAEVAAEMQKVAVTWLAELEAVEASKAKESALLFVAPLKGKTISVVVDSTPTDLKGKLVASAKG